MSPHPSASTPRPPPASYLWLLGWAFGIFNGVRTLAYLPTVWAIHTSGRSDQHSLFTWITWTGANATMAAWMFEANGRRMNRAIAVSAGNAVMCLATSVVIGWNRF